MYGFVYNSTSDDYFLVKTLEFDKPGESALFEEWVYSLRSDSWSGPRSYTSYNKSSKNWPVHVNGALHTIHLIPGSGFQGEKIKIIGYRVGSESDFEVPCPDGVNWKGVDVQLDELEGCLALICYYKYNFVVWIMEKYGEKDSWAQLNMFPAYWDIYNGIFCGKPWKEANIQLLAYVDGRNKILIDYHYFGKNICRWLIVFGVRKETFQVFELPLLKNFGLCIETLVSPCGYALEEEDKNLRVEAESKTPMGASGGETRLEEVDVKDSIFILGGYDGSSWSSALHSFSPSCDAMRSLKPMSSTRSHASVATLNGEIFVFGGGTASTWYNTVESYNSANDEWTQRPCLSKGKGSLAGAALNGKIYAVGGGNANECFSDVEMFDLDVGRWISARSMLEKRFALAAAELNGALNAVGGYDEFQYLKSAERFDPREHTWTKIKSLDAKRGCHSLVLLNEKLYALGGYDGTTMVPTVEIYDPRLETWMPGEPMSQARGYCASAVLNDSIYVVGGVQADEDVVNKVEVYKEGQGWEVANLTAVGKRCYASAIVLAED